MQKCLVLPIGVRLMVYSYLDLNHLARALSLSKKERKAIMDSRIIDQQISWEVDIDKESLETPMFLTKLRLANEQITLLMQEPSWQILKTLEAINNEMLTSVRHPKLNLEICNIHQLLPLILTKVSMDHLREKHMLGFVKVRFNFDSYESVQDTNSQLRNVHTF